MSSKVNGRFDCAMANGASSKRIANRRRSMSKTSRNKPESVNDCSLEWSDVERAIMY
jgi:hypothetical protein